MVSMTAAVTTVAAICAATVAVWHGSIDGQAFVALVSGALGLGAGAGIHAAGVSSGGGSIGGKGAGD